MENISTNYFQDNQNSRVVLQNLESRPELNGEIGTVEKYLKSGRLQIRTLYGEKLAIKTGNVRLFEETGNDTTGKTADMQPVPNTAATAQHTLECMQTQLFVWQSTMLFYPFGNTPAKMLTRYFPPLIPTVTILLLGCGDPRHVFFTAWTHLKSRSAFRSTLLQVTMCDIEISILARNTILFKLIMENSESDNRIWCLFYAQFIDQSCMDMLVQCANDLLAIGRDLASWHSSPLGSVFRFCDERTYDMVRTMWLLYANGRLSEDEEREKTRQRLSLLGHHLNKTGTGTGGEKLVPLDTMMLMWPTKFEAMNDSMMHLALAEDYRDQGRAPTCIYASTAAASAHVLNPMLLRGPEQKPEVHYSLDPTMGFHKSMLYVETNPSDPSVSLHSTDGPVGPARDGRPSADMVYSLCFGQFSEWIAAFRQLVTEKLVVIRSHCGDALFFCDVLADGNHSASTSSTSSSTSFRGAQTMRVATLQTDVPRVYDVIDTSNLSDSQGLLSMLCVAHTLLCPRRGVIFTGLLSSAGPASGGLQAFLEQELRVDLPTFSAITNMQLIDSPSAVTAHYGDVMTSFDAVLQDSIKSGLGIKAARTLEWRMSSPTKLCATITMTNGEFVDLFFNIYRRLFKATHGDGWSVEAILKSMTEQLVNSHGQNRFAQPTMQTFARFVAWAAQHVVGIERPVVFMDLLDRLQHSGLALQGHVHGELVLFFVRVGLLPLGWGSEDRLMGLYHPPCHPRSLLTASTSPFFAVTLLVPKKELVRLGRVCSVGAVPLEMGIGDKSTFDVTYNSIHFSFIKHRALPSDDDWAERKAGADVVLSSFALTTGHAGDFAFGAFTFLAIKIGLVSQAADDTTVRLACYSGALETHNEQVKEFGILKCVFGRRLSDTSHVSCENIPMDEIRLPFCQLDMKGPPTGINTNEAASTVNNLFPVFPEGPVVARHSAAVASGGGRMGGALGASEVMGDKTVPKAMPTAMSDRVLQLWGLHRVVLDSLPPLDLNRTDPHGWLNLLTRAQISRSERAEQGNAMECGPVTSMKDTIHTMVSNLIEVKDDGTRWPRLYCLSRIRSQVILLYVNAVRVDLSVGSVVLDIAINFLTRPLLRDVLPLFSDQSHGSVGLHSVRMTEDEHELWLLAAPALQERARDGWAHRSDCEYFAGGRTRIPRLNRGTSAEPMDPPICSCGSGRASLAGTPFFKKYAAKYPKAVAQFTRVAVSPLFQLFDVHSLAMQASKKGDVQEEAQQKRTSVSDSAKIKGGRSGGGGESLTSVVTSTAAPDPRKCATCATGVALFACSRCKAKLYCGRECQRAHWIIHKRVCLPVER